MTKSFLKGLAVAGLGLALVANTAQAQKPGPEIGVQFVTLQMSNPDGDGNNSTDFGLGSGNLTVAFYLTEMIALEPMLTFDYSSPETGDAQSSWGLNVGVPIYLKKGWGKAGGLFVTPFIGYNSISSGGNSGGAMHFGANAGTKIKISDNLFWRGAVGFDMGQENTDDGIPKMTTIGLQFGLTAFLK